MTTMTKAPDINYARDLIKTSMASYYQTYSITWNETYFADLWQNGEFFELWYDSQRVGILGYIIDDNTCSLRDIHLEPEFQGQGLGSLFMKQLIENMYAQNYHAIRLMVFVDNPAKKLYQRLGFQIKGESETLIKMQLDL